MQLTLAESYWKSPKEHLQIYRFEQSWVATVQIGRIQDKFLNIFRCFLLGSWQEIEKIIEKNYIFI
jgi:hypothetical protein